MSEYQLAHINIAEAIADMESDVMQGFVSRLDEINALADQAPGFIWRLQDEEDDNVFDDPRIVVNISVWDDIDSLKTFVYKSIHIELIQGRDAWFKKMPLAHQALWWVPVGHIPSEQEGKQKLEHIREHGPTQEAFTFGRSFPRP